MSIQKNLSGLYVPVREQRQTAGTLTALNAEVVHTVNGDDSALIFINTAGVALSATLEFSGSIDGVNYFFLPVVPFTGVGGALPSFAQPLTTDLLTAITGQRAYALKTSQLSKIRVRFSLYTSGSCDVTVNSDANRSLHPAISDGRPTTLYLGATAAVGVATSISLPAVANLRHYIDFIVVQRIASAALTVGASVVAATASANLPAGLVGDFAFGQDAAAQGTMMEIKRDFGGTGLAANVIGTASGITMPATAGVIWRISMAYRVGV